MRRVVARQMIRATVGMLIVLLLCGQTCAAGEKTVLGLYASWQTGEIPSAVSSVSYDGEHDKLIITLHPGEEEYKQWLLEQVEDPERMDVRVLPQKETRESESGSRIRGVLALGGAYLGALGVAAMFFFLRGSRKKAGKPDGLQKLNNWMGGSNQ